MSNTISLSMLKAGLDKLSGLSLAEEEVQISGTSIILRTLTANEHKAVNTYVAAYMKALEEQGDLEETHATLEFFTIRKIEPLAYAIIKLGDLDLRNINYMPVMVDGEIDENHKVEKHVWMRQFLGDMELAVVDTLHSKYIDLLKSSEERAAKDIKFRNPEDELEHLEKRRQTLLSELGVEEPEEDNTPEVPSKGIKEAVFSPVKEDEVPEKEEEVGKFIRLDDPEKPYSDAEVEYLEEQERLLAAREGNPITAKIQKARQPLNNALPQVFEAGDPINNPFPRKEEDPNSPALSQKQGPKNMALDQQPVGGKNPNFRG